MSVALYGRVQCDWTSLTDDSHTCPEAVYVFVPVPTDGVKVTREELAHRAWESAHQRGWEQVAAAGGGAPEIEIHLCPNHISRRRYSGELTRQDMPEGYRPRISDLVNRGLIPDGNA